MINVKLPLLWIFFFFNQLIASNVHRCLFTTRVFNLTDKSIFRGRVSGSRATTFLETAREPRKFVIVA